MALGTPTTRPISADWIFAGINRMDVRVFLAKGDGITDNLQAFKDAVAATPVGGTLIIPNASSFYSVNTSGGLSTAIVIDKRMIVEINGQVKATYGAQQANPPTIFSVTANDVTFIGTGSLIGNGTVDDVNAGTDDTMPCLIRVSGHRFSISGLTIDTPPKTGIHLYGADDARITDCKFTGGVTAYSGTAYFAIRGYQGSRAIIAHNRFFPNAAGGMFVSCIFLSNTNYSLIKGNIAYRPYEKLIYCAASYNVIDGNTVIGNSGLIPGTAQAGTVGAAYRADGIYNKVTNNFSRYGGGVQSLGGLGTHISGNTFIDCGQSAITVHAGVNALSDLQIKDNLCTCGNLVGIVATNGIYVEPVTGFGLSKNIQITGNTVRGFSPSGASAQISVVAPGVGEEVTRAIISDNNVAEGFRGISTNYMINSFVHGNRIHATDLHLVETNGAANRYEANPVEGAADVGVSGLSATSIFDGPVDWVPVLSDGVNNAVMGGTGANHGTFTRRGRSVYVTGQIATTDLGAVAGAVRIIGLPVAAAAGLKHRAAISVALASNLNIAAGQAVAGWIDGGNAYISLQLWDAITGLTDLQAAEWSSDGNIVFSLVYTAA